MKVWKSGGCHCGKIRFKVQADFKQGLICNCSICTKKGFLHLIVDKNDFVFLSKEQDLSTYTFGTHSAKHHFCSYCGITSYYIPRSHPDGFSINLRCLDDLNLEDLTFKSFDGRHWEDNIHLIK